MNSVVVDTNVLLRVLGGDPKDQALAAKQLFVRAANGEMELEVSAVVVAEAMYTLTSFYKVDRVTASESLAKLVSQPGVRIREGRVVLMALATLKSTNIGFADAFLAAIADAEGKKVASFDRDFDRLAPGIRILPAPPKDL